MQLVGWLPHQLWALPHQLSAVPHQVSRVLMRLGFKMAGILHSLNFEGFTGAKNEKFFLQSRKSIGKRDILPKQLFSKELHPWLGPHHCKPELGKSMSEPM